MTTGGSTATVYTKEGTEFYVADQSRYLTTDGDVLTNRNNIAALQTTTTDLEGRVSGVEGKVTTLEGTVGNDSRGLVKNVNDLKTQGTTLNNALGSKADKSDLDEAKAKITENEGKITDLQTKTANLSDDGTKLTGMNSVETGALKVTGQISNGTVTTTLADINQSMEQTKKNTTDIVALKNTTTKQQTTIDSLKEATTRISYDKANDTTSINGMKVGQRVDMGGKDLTRVGAINGTKIGTKVDGTYIHQDSSIWGNLKTVDTQVETNADAIAKETEDRKAAIGELTVGGKYIKKGMNVSDNLVELDRQAKTNADNIQTNADNIKNNKDEIARVNGELVKTNNYFNKELGKTNDYFNKELSNANNHFNTELGKTNAALQATNKRTGGITRNDAANETKIEGNVTVDNLGNVSAKGAVNAGSLNVTGASVLKGDVTLGTPNGTNKVTVNGTANFHEVVNMGNGLNVDKGLTVTSGESNLKNTTVDGTLSVNKETTLKKTDVDGALTVKGEATFKDKVTMEKDLEVKGELKTDKIAMEHTGTDPDGTRYNSSTTITADGITHIGEVEKSGVTTKSSFTHTEEGSETYAMKGDKTDWTETRSDVKADGVKTEVKDSKGNRTNTSQNTEVINGFAIDEDGNSSTTSQTAKDINGNVTDKDGNKTDMKVTATENSIQIQDKDGKNTNLQVNTMGSSVTEIKNGDGKTTKTEQTATDITNTAEQGTIKNNAMNIENNASGNITNNAQNGTIKNNAKDIVNNATGDMTNTVGGKLTTTVTGQATENFNGGLDTKVTGEENHTVTGKQTNTVGGGQINNITGGQKNNILTGDQETTVSNGSIINKAENGNISNTAKNVTNEGTESVTNKVGANEVKVSTNGVDITVDADKTIKESVGADTSRTMTDGRIIDKAGNMTVTTDKTTGTTFENGTPNDTTVINGGTIGTNKVNANETNTKKLTAGADDGADGGRLTVDARDGVQGSYKSGDYTSKSYILANTLKSGVDNGKEPTDTDFVGSRTDHYMDGDKAKLDETVKDADGSNVTNKTSTDTVTTITDDTNTSIIDQKKDSITSAVGDGTTSTVIKQDKDNVTIASSAGTVGIAGKNIINNATDTITNTAGTKITDTAGDSSVTTENGKGTTFTNTGANTAIGEGTVTDTTIKGNTITTGKVTMDYADVMKDLGVRGNANITGKTTTGLLEVTGTSTLKGDVTMGSNATVGNDLTVKGITTTKTLKVIENAEIGGNATIAGDVTAKSYKVGDKTYISEAGINANDQKITNVADGSISEGSKDAVNGGQLYSVKNDLEGKVNKVGANAAAMANLHPMEFDPDSKWNIAAAIGNYGSETAAALGAFYRPNDDVMVNLSTAFGTGENMVGGGVSVRLGKGGNKLSREENNALKDQVNDLTARMDALLSVLNPNMSKDFPDVPENHWAYEAVSRLAGNDIVQGYPDGEFHGERTMTRYEMAEIIYNALSRGAEAERELVEEFKPELQAMAASEKATAEKAEG